MARCAVSGCPAGCPDEWALCRVHWGALPVLIRGRVGSTPVSERRALVRAWLESEGGEEWARVVGTSPRKAVEHAGLLRLPPVPVLGEPKPPKPDDGRTYATRWLDARASIESEITAQVRYNPAVSAYSLLPGVLSVTRIERLVAANGPQEPRTAARFAAWTAVERALVSGATRTDATAVSDAIRRAGGEPREVLGELIAECSIVGQRDREQRAWIALAPIADAEKRIARCLSGRAKIASAILRENEHKSEVSTKK